ncbi:MAG TPA: amidase [Actinomycetota bacterium]|nr:amidase [Actinomycetota bacterium]
MTGLRYGELETAIQMLGAVRARHVAPAELLERTFERLHLWQPVTNAFSQVWEGEALAAARRLMSDPSGMATGVPLAIKDLFDVAGHETTGCCAAYRGTKAAADAPIVDRMRQAEMVFVGKTNQHELAAGGTNLVSACGPTANPWNADRMTGGSSGGSAAAVAAGVVPWALGSDTGGSIRIPSSMCGTFGLKPTTGRLPLQGLMPLAPSLDCPGPIASTAGDLRLLYHLMVGSDWESAGDGDRPVGRRWRIGVPGGFFADRVHADVLDLVQKVATTFEASGAEVEALDGRGVEDSRRVWSRICYPEFGAAHPRLEEKRGDVAPTVWAWIDEGRRLTVTERAEAARRREEIRRWYRSQLQTFDALLIPSTPYPAPNPTDNVIDLGRGETVEAAAVGPGWITCSVNLAGLPALNLPAGRSADGLPIGVSLVGDENRDEALLDLASQWEAATGYHPRRPQVPVPGAPLRSAPKDRA